LTPPVPRHEIVAFESLHLPLRQMHDPYATKVADSCADNLPRILAAGGMTPQRKRGGDDQSHSGGRHRSLDPS
jgi:hypothetical protein